MSDDSSGILFYLLSIVVALVWSAVKSYRKFKQQTPTTATEEQRQWQEDTVTFEELLASQPAEAPADIDLIRYRQAEQKRKQAMERNRKQERDQRFATLFRENEQLSAEEEGGGIRNFDVKEAIIYSEIINRKYE
jgi:membrane protein involved in colicin uptake